MNRLKGLKLKFDVTDNPELSEAIQKRVFELGGEWCGDKTGIAQLTKSYFLFLDDGRISMSETNRQHFNNQTNILAYIEGLYHLPKTHTISFDGEDDIEISAESFAALKKSLIK